MKELTELQPILGLLVSLCTLVGIALAVYRSYSNPANKIMNEFSTFRAKTEEKIKSQKDDIYSIKQDIYGIKENHLTHLERDVAAIKATQESVITILDERLPRKN